MDIKDFYPSIIEETLDATIVFAQTNTNIGNDDIQITKHSGKSLLFHNAKAWRKKSESCFMLLWGAMAVQKCVNL